MIQNPVPRAPHQGGQSFHTAPNAALLIDFDNVTMGIRSDLGKELKALLNSEVIRGKVAVQRAYADWRRYPQYIVPLAESSIDLIFAPAYGSSKKNATDLRMAIDAIELVFTRPEIGTYILMTGDSDFSSCVLKLKEYGKYVIGVGMRESSSDLLIQNCDEYYSYHALSGLTRSDEVSESKEDPWVLLKRAAQQMVASRDVMRTDRLKQVMLDLDPAFDEKKIGYSKFSRFVHEAANKGLIRLRKGENGQYEIALDEGEGAARPAAERTAAPRAEAAESGDGRRRRGRGGEPRRESRAEAPQPTAAPAAEEAKPAAEARPAAEPQAAPVPEAKAAPERAPAAEAAPAPELAADDVQSAYGLLQQAVRQLGGRDGKSVRDGDVKRKMLELSPGFDESALGFSKFTRFLRQAHDAEAIDLKRASGGNYEVSLPASGRRFETAERPAQAPAAKAEPAAAAKPAEEAPAATRAPEAAPAAKAESAGARAGVSALRGRRPARGAAPAGPPPLLPGQVKQVGKPVTEEAPKEEAAEPAAAAETAEAPAKSRSRRGRRGRGARAEEAAPTAAPAQEAAAADQPEPRAEAKPEPKSETAEAPKPEANVPARRGRGRGRGRATTEGPPPLLPGQVKQVSKPAAEAPAQTAAPAATETAEPEAPKKRRRSRGRKPAAGAPAAPGFSAAALGLPTEPEAVTAYLTDSYKGVGRKTAETLLEASGGDVFRVLQEEPARVREQLGDRRAQALLDQWAADYARRAPAAEPAAAPEPQAEAQPEPTTTAVKKTAAKKATAKRPAAKKATAKKSAARKRPAAKAAATEAPAAEPAAAQAEEAPKPKKTRRGGRGRSRGKKKEPTPTS